MKSIINLTVCVSILFSSCFAQKTESYIDHHSLSSLFVISTNKNDTLGNATAFTYKTKNNNIYLITNNHVVGGEYFKVDFYNKNKRFPTEKEIPDTLKVRFNKANLFDFQYISVPLKDKKGNPNYIRFYADEKNPSLNTILDIVAIQLSPLDTSLIKLYPYTSSDYHHFLPIFPGTELFIVGFPLSSGYADLPYPIWKRGTIASDATFNNFYIDATTRPGMSGSPVVFRSDKLTTTNGNVSVGTNNTFLVGIYYAQNLQSEIGVVTKIDFLINKLN